MAKTKANVGAVANRPAYSRVSFLYQAAALLAAAAPTPATLKKMTDGAPDQQQPEESSGLQKQLPPPSPPVFGGMSRRLLTQMRSISRKTNMRLRPAVKRSVCKFCDTLLVEGDTCVSVVENKSRDGKKPWADVLAVQCRTCGHVRRYPVTAPRQPRRPLREGSRGDEKTNANANTGSKTTNSKLDAVQQSVLDIRRAPG